MRLAGGQRTFGYATVLAFVIMVGVSSSPAQQSQSADVLQESTLRAKVQALDLSHRPGSSPAWHVSGAEDRAGYLQSLLDDQRTFFRQKFSVDVPIGLAVLDQANWAEVAPNIPYGMPHVSRKPFTAVMPANWDEVRWLPFPTREQADPRLAQESEDLGLDWDQALRTGADLIATHEFGHTLLHQLNVDPRSPWLGERPATYAGYAFIAERRPELVGPNRLFNLAVANGPHPHTSLRYLDENYFEVVTKTPANYGWYQGRLFERAEAVYAEHGLAFLSDIKRVFARGEPMTHDQVLDQLERINPGWKAWAASMEAIAENRPQ
jgi:hypothetical protein